MKKHKPLVRGLKLIFIIFVVILPVFITSKVFGENKRVVLILINSTTWPEIQKSGNKFLLDIATQEASGLISNRVVKSPTTLTASTLTVSAGNRAVSSKGYSLAFSADENYKNESVRTIFNRSTGVTLSSKAVAAIQWPMIIKENAKLNDVYPGLLGEALDQAKKKIAVIGNADTGIEDDNLYRQAVFIVANRRGYVKEGNVGKDLLKKDDSRPYGLATDYKRLWSEYQRYASYDLLVVDTGDTFRADQFSFESDPLRAWGLKKKAINEAASFTKKVVQNDPSKVVIITSLLPPIEESGRRSASLGPIIITGINSRGKQLTSKITNQPTIVTNVDIASSILTILKVKEPRFMGGSVITTIDRKPVVSQFSKQVASYDFIEKIYRPTIIIYVTYLILVLLSSLLLIFLKKDTKPIYYKINLLALLSVIAIPLASYLTRLVVPYVSSLPIFIVTLTLLASAIVVISWIPKNKSNFPLAIVVVSTVGVLTIDLLAGGKLNLNSIFGHLPVVAGRFYGMGNQAMSIYVTSTVVGFAIFFDIAKLNLTRGVNFFMLAIFGMAVIFVGFPKLGSNIGGTLTAIAVFCTFFLYVNRPIANKYFVVGIPSAAIVLLLLLALIDYLFLQSSTHLGRTVEMIIDGGIVKVYKLAAWKLAGNYRILKSTSWIYLFLTAVLSLMTLKGFEKGNHLDSLFSEYPYIAAGLISVMIGGIVGGIFNDSGISIPAIMWAYYLVVMFYLILVKRLSSRLLYQ